MFKGSPVVERWQDFLFVNKFGNVSRKCELRGMKTTDLIIGKRYWFTEEESVSGIYIGTKSDHWEIEGSYFNEVTPKENSYGDINGDYGFPLVCDLPFILIDNA